MRRQDEHSEERRREVENFLAELAGFQLAIKDVAQKCPKDWKMRDKALAAALEVIKRDELLQRMREQKSIPWKMLKQKEDLAAKGLENHEPCIIALALVMGGPYPFLMEHLELWLKTYRLRATASVK